MEESPRFSTDHDAARMHQGPIMVLMVGSADDHRLIENLARRIHIAVVVSRRDALPGPGELPTTSDIDLVVLGAPADPMPGLIAAARSWSDAPILVLHAGGPGAGTQALAAGAIDHLDRRTADDDPAVDALMGRCLGTARAVALGRLAAGLFLDSDEALIRHGADGRIIDINRRAGSMVVPPDRPTPAWLAQVLDGETWAAWSLRIESLATEADSTCSVVPFEGRLLGESEPGKPVELRLRRLLGACGTEYLTGLRDTSRRKSAEEHLRRSEQLLQTVISHAPVVLFATDREGIFTLSEGRGLQALGLAPGQVIGQSVFTLYGRWPAITDAITRALAGESFTLDAVLNDMVFETHYAPIMEHGEVVGILGVATDLTDRRHSEEALRRSEEQLRQSQKMEAVGRLAGGVAHDFNNILTAIFGYAEILSGKLGEQPALRSHVDKILSAAQRAAGLTRQLLTFSRKQVVRLRVLDLNSIVSTAHHLLRRLIGEDIDLHFKPASNLGHIRADRSQIEQIVINLAVNAREAMPGGGRLLLETFNEVVAAADASRYEGALPGDHIVLQVTDTGCGMSAEVLAHIFEPFFTTKEQGTGLGLSTVYGIVRQNKGHIRVVSAANQGTSFRIYLPRVMADRDESRGVPVITDGAGGTEVILLAEDEDSVRTLSVNALRSNGYTVLEAANGLEAMEIATRHNGPIHLLITDLIMPRLGGRDLSISLRAERPSLRVLYVSGYGGEDGLPPERSGEVFLHKPFTVHALLQTARALLDGSRGPDPSGSSVDRLRIT